MAKPAGQRADPAVLLCWQDQGRGGYGGVWHGGGCPGGQGGRAYDPTEELGGVCPAGDLSDIKDSFSQGSHVPFHSISLPANKNNDDEVFWMLRQSL